MISVEQVVEELGRPVTVMAVVDALADDPYCPTMREAALLLSSLKRQGHLRDCGYDRRWAGNRARRYVRVLSGLEQQTLDIGNVRAEPNIDVRDTNIRGCPSRQK